jgi:single-strand DNA-binding protein
MNINRVEFSGNLAADAAQREAGSTNVTSFRIAVNPQKRKGKEEGETMWFGCSVWGERGTALLPYLKKGQRVIVFGRLSQRTFEKDGESRTSFDINVDSIDFVTSGDRSGEDTMVSAKASAAELPF